MKIVLTCHQFLPQYAAGTEVLTLETARALRGMGHEVSIFTSVPYSEIDGGHCVDDSHDGFAVRRYIPRSASRTEPYDAARNEYDDPLLGELFKAHLIERAPDIVHFLHLSRLTTSAAKATQSLGIASVFTPTDFWAICPAFQLRLPNHKICAGPDPDALNCLAHMARSLRPTRKIRRLSWLPKLFLRLFLRALDTSPLRQSRLAVNVRSMQQRGAYIRDALSGLGSLVVPSKIMLDKLSQYGYPPDKLRLARYGLVGARGYPPHRIRAEGAAAVIGFIGSISEHKGAHVLIEAVTSLPASLHCTLRIYGNEQDSPNYARHLRALAGKDPRIVFLGTFPNAQIGEVLSDIDALCVPSIWLENIPLVLLSAQAAGVPILATNLGGMSEVVHHGVNGFVFPPSDHKALARIIGNLIRDPALLAKVTAAVMPPKDINDYARECEAEYHKALAAMRPT